MFLFFHTVKGVVIGNMSLNHLIMQRIVANNDIYFFMFVSPKYHFYLVRITSKPAVSVTGRVKRLA